MKHNGISFNSANYQYQLVIVIAEVKETKIKYKKKNKIFKSKKSTLSNISFDDFLEYGILIIYIKIGECVGKKIPKRW